jgi:hypothetical protein
MELVLKENTIFEGTDSLGRDHIFRLLDTISLNDRLYSVITFDINKENNINHDYTVLEFIGGGEGGDPPRFRTIEDDGEYSEVCSHVTSKLVESFEKIFSEEEGIEIYE